MTVSKDGLFRITPATIRIETAQRDLRGLLWPEHP